MCPLRPEPIRQLMSENVSRTQIAKIYGFRRPDNSPDLEKLQEEIDNPGTHYDPLTWVHPRDKQFWEEIERRWTERKNLLSRAAEVSQAQERKRVAFETIEELILQGVNAEQIAKMKRVSVEQVRVKAAEMGISLDSTSVGYATYWDAQRGMEAKRQETLRQSMTRTAINLHSELGNNREARILALRDDGIPPLVILESLKPHFSDLQYSDVAVTLAKAEKTRNGAATGKPDHATT
jgi:hypothetical protein